MRIFAWDSLEPFAVLNSITIYVYLPAWLTTLFALQRRMFLLAGLSLVIVVAQIAFELPELQDAKAIPKWANSAESLRLLDANVYFENSSMRGYIADIRRLHPQLLTMEEAVPNDVSQLTASGALSAMQYRIEIKLDDPTAFFVASSYPLVGSNVVYFKLHPLMVQTTVELPSGRFSLWVIHTTAPLPSTFSLWREQLAYIDSLLKKRGSKRLVMVGDFNATWGNKGFRALLKNGVDDAAAERGVPFDMTWSQTVSPIPPFMRIDHVLTGGGTTVSQIGVENGRGSDHRALAARLAIRVKT
jgi:endonuclease/exonuclease/phosphatase (EEP) superfamily protein YafD